MLFILSKTELKFLQLIVLHKCGYDNVLKNILL